MPALSRLTLICHAATAATRAGRFAADEPLLTGVRPQAQIRRLAAHLSVPHCVVHAPLRAARETAQALGFGIGVEAPALRGADAGQWRGLAIETLAQQAPEALARWLTQPEAAPPGGESLLDLLARLGAWLDAWERPGLTLAVVPPDVMRGLLVNALTAPPTSFWRLDVTPLSFSDLRRGPQGWRLRAMAQEVPDQA